MCCFSRICSSIINVPKKEFEGISHQLISVHLFNLENFDLSRKCDRFVLAVQFYQGEGADEYTVCVHYYCLEKIRLCDFDVICVGFLYCGI